MNAGGVVRMHLHTEIGPIMAMGERFAFQVETGPSVCVSTQGANGEIPANRPSAHTSDATET